MVPDPDLEALASSPTTIFAEEHPYVPAQHFAHEPAEHHAFNWSKVPPVTKTPRAGWFTFNPSGPGYYSLQDYLHDDFRQKAPPAPFGTTGSNATPLYDYDFRYLDHPDNTYHMWSDALKRVICNDDFLFSSGGEFRYRYNDYTNTQLRGVTESFHFTRLRVYGDLSYRDQARAFVEMIDARAIDEPLPLGASDATGTDFLNAFGEFKIDEFGGSPLQLRVGRQELVLGSQRLISSPDFSNTLRTYDGIRGYWHSPKWSVDLFWVRPVIPNLRKLDSSDDHRELSGLFATRHPDEHTLIDLYLLNLTDTRVASIGDTTTFGARVAGDIDRRLLYDFEAMAQVGTSGGKTVSAQATATGLGWHFAELPWSINFWTYFEYASGTNDPTSNKHETFNQLFPAGHTYFGYIDLVGRQNIEDLNFQLQLNPQPWLQLKMQYHILRLAKARDALYNSGGIRIRQDLTGTAGKEVGSELDLMANIHVNAHQDILIGYSRLFAGSFIRQTGPGQDPQYTYAQYSVRW